MQMEQIQRQEDFQKVYDIMAQSFPPCERRTYEKAEQLLLLPEYHIYTLRGEDGAPCAFLAAWQFEQFRFVEHFAVSRQMRGAGLGSRMMRAFLLQKNLPACLEVEEPVSETARRRVEFYKRLGFVLTNFGYIQPNLQKSQDQVSLKMMSFPHTLSSAEFESVKQMLFARVYGLDELT